jgi:hypothetical protein
MTDSPRQDGAPTAFGAADPTRDIRLPAIADRPPSVLPREWSGVQPPSPQPASPQPAAPQPAPSPQPASREPSRAGGGPAATRNPPVDLQTDDLQAPRPPRERTIAFASPEAAVGRPTPTVQRKPRPPRRWPWVMVALLPVLVIVVSGVWLFLLLRAA